MLKHPLGRGAELFVSTLLMGIATAAPQAQTTTGSDSPETSSSSDSLETHEPGVLDEVVVTGTTSSSRTVLTSSVALTVATREDLERKAPRSTAQALEIVPGIFVEASGGEVSNNFSVRGLAGGGQQFIQLSEDGLPIFYTRCFAASATASHPSPTRKATPSSPMTALHSSAARRSPETLNARIGNSTRSPRRRVLTTC